MSKPRTPKTLAGATLQLARYAALEAQLAEINAERQRGVARVEAAADQQSAPIVAELAELAGAIEPWWIEARAELTQGKRKSIELGGCSIGNRATSAKLVFTGTDEEALEKASSSRWRSLLTKTEVKLDRSAIVKLLASAGKMADSVRELGFSAAGGEVFFIKRVDNPNAKITGR